ncbi:hypothetical protein E8F20_27670 [Pseudomonas sp. BN415]|uniref:hypothetical protein n=1 Tax=Pseudomonas sp. BN415 TaxID=2567889 RepID=UPI0024565F5C|nr:hypothetical protein [Pseudomonas sp. BN415]MDH4585631.1 hypothetical protein [Pseudomonas sp. BN415]
MHDLEDADDFGCLGVPTDEEMLRQQVLLLESEYQECANQLRKAKQNIRHLVEQQQRVNDDRSRLRVQVEELTRRVEWLDGWIKAHPQTYEPLHPTWNTIKSNGIQCYPVPANFDPMK